MTKEELVRELKFVKVNNDLYNVDINEDIFLDYLTKLLESFTVNKNGTFSGIMDLPLSEELISRIIADAFVYKYKKIVDKLDGSVVLNLNISEITYKIIIANNKEKLGGIIYGSVT